VCSRVLLFSLAGKKSHNKKKITNNRKNVKTCDFCEFFSDLFYY